MPNSPSQFMIYASVHFQNCPIEIRELWSLISNSEIVHEVISIEIKENIEFVNIGTCNRYDLCLFGKVTKTQILKIFARLKNYTNKNEMNGKLNEFQELKLFDNIEKYIAIYFDYDAMSYLFQVSSSLTSLVLGEQQIFGQIKMAYKNCVEKGYARKKSAQIFNENFRVTKKIRTETDIGKNCVSIGTAVGKLMSQIFSSIESKKVLILGAGQMANIMCKNIVSLGIRQLFIANRSLVNAQNLANQFSNVQCLELNQSLSDLHLFDVCIVALGGQDEVISENIIDSYEKKRLGKLTLFVDISIPRKINSKLNFLENLFLFNLDDLDKVMTENKLLRQKSAQKAIDIIQIEIEKYKVKCLKQMNASNISRMDQWIKNLIQYEVERYLYDTERGKKTNSTIVANAISKRIISNVAKISHAQTNLGLNDATVGDMLEYLFQLSTQQKLEFKRNYEGHNVISLHQKKG